MFGWFRRKAPGSGEAPPDAPAHAPRPEEEKAPSLEERTLGFVAARFPEAVSEGTSLCFPDRGGLRLEVRFSDLDGPRFRMKARLKHPSFFGPLLESVAWAAEGDEEKARVAAKQLTDTVLDALLPALKGRGEALPPTAVWGRERRFSASVSGMVLINAKQPPGGQDLWSRMRRAVLDCLGTQKVYWVKLQLARIGEDTGPCEVRINNWVVPELSRMLAELAQDWPAGEAPLQCVKQYAVLVRTEDSAPPCPYTWEQALALTRKAICLFEGGVDYNEIPRALERDAPDPSLAEDVFSFMPELMTKCLLAQAKTSSRLTLHPQGGEPVELWCTQCRTWMAVYQAVCDHLVQDRPSREQLMTIVGTSAMSHTLSSALNGGSRLEDLVLYQTFRVSERYQLW